MENAIPFEGCPFHAKLKTAAPPAARRFADVTGPKGPPVLGWRHNAFTFLTQPIQFMSALREAHGNVARLSSGSNPSLFVKPFSRDEVQHPATVFAFGADCNRSVLSDLETFQTRLPRGPQSADFDALSHNILFSNDAEHKRRRVRLMEVLKGSSLKAYHGTMIDLTQMMLDRWQAGTVVDIEREMAWLSMNISSRCLYGLDATSDSENLAVRMCEMMNSLFSPVNLIPLDLPGTPYRRLLRNISSIKADLEQLIRSAQDSDGHDILSIIVRQQVEEHGQLNTDDLVGDAFVTFFAGHDTVHDALAWTLLLLAQHPEVAADLHEEISQASPDGVLSYEQIFKLPLLDRVVKESLRVLGPALLFPRVVAKDTELGGFEVPRGTEVVFSPYMTHIDPELYDDPHRFDPDRWRDIKPSAYEYLPFGAGRRTCLGAALGTMMLKLIVPMILQRFRLETVERDIDIRFHAVMGPKGGLPMRLHPQDQRFEDSPARIGGQVGSMVEW